MGRAANKLMIKTDDDLRDAQQELGFAEAEFGSDQAQPLRQALDGAREELNAAFAVGQKLDDAEPETPEQRRVMIQEIIDRCNKAQQVIAQQSAQLARLRDLERTAGEVLATARRRTGHGRGSAARSRRSGEAPGALCRREHGVGGG